MIRLSLILIVLTSIVLSATPAFGQGAIGRAVAAVDSTTFTMVRGPLLSRRVPNKAERWILKACLGLHTYGQALDTVTTIQALKLPGFREANPVLRPFAHKRGPLVAAKAAYWAGSTYAFVRIAEDHPRWSALAACASGAYSTRTGIRNRNLIRSPR